MYVAIIAIASLLSITFKTNRHVHRHELLVSVAAFAIGTAIAPRATRMLKQAIS